MKALSQLLLTVTLSVLAFSSLSQSLPEDKFFDSSGTRIRYIELGSGEPIIAIHGFTRNSDSWLGSVSELAETHRLILFDQRGHGLSDKPHAVSEYGREMGHDVIRLMDHLSIPKAHLLGYSLGVAPIGMLITEYESRFISAVYGGNAARWDWGNADDLLNQQMNERRVNSNRPLPPIPGAEGQDQIALAYLRLAEKELIVSKVSLANIDIPVMAIVGSEDPALEALNEFKDILHSLELVVVEGESHNSLPIHPEFMERVKEFLTRVGEN